MKKANYGIDAPPVVRNLALVGIGGIATGFLANYFLIPILPTVGQILTSWGICGGLAFVISSLLMIWSSKVGKLRERERLLDSLNLKGSEMVLDVGCGRGLLLIGAAKRLKTGKAFGVDIWQTVDQSGNQPETTLENAQAEGVAERVELRTGDARELPFPDHTFDVIVSSLALHNIYDPAGREKAVREISRVLRPGGRVAILDFQRTGQYAQVLRQLDWENVQRTGLHFWIFPPVRWVTGTKPA